VADGADGRRNDRRPFPRHPSAHRVDVEKGAAIARIKNTKEVEELWV